MTAGTRRLLVALWVTCLVGLAVPTSYPWVWALGTFCVAFPTLELAAWVIALARRERGTGPSERSAPRSQAAGRAAITTPVRDPS